VKYALDDDNLSPAELRLKSCLRRKDDRNVLYMSCARGYTFTVAKLLSHMKNITRTTTDFDNYTRQAFFYAIHHGRVDTIDALEQVRHVSLVLALCLWIKIHDFERKNRDRRSTFVSSPQPPLPRRIDA